MAVIVLLSPQIIVNSVDLSNHIDTVTINESFAAVDTTAFGSAGSKTYVAGLGDHKITLNFQQDFAASSVEATIYPLIGTAASFNIKPLAGTTSTTNPAYTGLMLVDGWTPITGKVGALMMSSVTWPVSGVVTKATS
jgi:hypothetical protein